MATTTSALDSSSALSSAMGSALSSATGSSMLDKDSFLLLLVTEFKHQDPLNPMEDREFVAQLAQFSSLEQQMQTNENMQTLVELEQRTQMLNAASYIGKEVPARGTGVSVMDGVVSELLFAPTQEVASCNANIWDSNNNLIAVLDLGARSAGIHSLNWDGRKLDGLMAPNGVYTVSFEAKTAKGEGVTVDTSVSGTVVGVSTSGSEQVLRLSDGRYVALSNVRELVQPGTAATGENIISVTDGEAEYIEYRLADKMISGKALVYSGHTLVASEALGEKSPGVHLFEWDGKDSSGKPVKDGKYTVKIEGYASNGSSVHVEYLGVGGGKKPSTSEAGA